MVSSVLAKPFLGASVANSVSAFGFPALDLGRRPCLQFLICTPSSRKLHRSHLGMLVEIKAAGSTFGTHFRATTFGESHGGGVGCIVDGCPPRLPFSEADLQLDLDRRSDHRDTDHGIRSQY
ncbi:hypothetical protein NL676_037286 [Syzygium grande]|nr:hypothetical protein NL676_037286 [Syzygium grande]